MTALRLSPYPGRWSIVRLPVGSPAPVGAFAVLRTDRETSIVVPAGQEPPLGQVEAPFRILEVEGPLPFDAVGILAGLSAILAEAGIPIFALSTFDTDYLLVPEARFEAACGAFEGAGVAVRARAGRAPEHKLS